MNKNELFSYVLDDVANLNYSEHIPIEQSWARYYELSLIDLYFSEICKYPLLSKEQEVELGKKLKLKDNLCILKNFHNIDNSLIIDLEKVFVSIDDYDVKEYVLGKLKYYYNNNSRGEATSTKVVKYYLNEYEELCKISADRVPNVLELNDFFKDKEYNEFRCFRESEKLSSFELIEQVDMFFSYMIARDMFCSCNLRLVVSIASYYASPRMKFLDCIEEGNLGLIRAVDKFDVNKGYKFSTYATKWIMQKIIRAKERLGLPVNIGLDSHMIMKQIENLEDKYGREFSNEELAMKLNVSVDKIRNAKDWFYCYDCYSLEEIIEQGKEYDVIENITGDVFSYDIDDLVDGIVERELLDSFYELLTDRELEVLGYRFGFGDINGTKMTLKETGNVIGVSKQRVSQIEEIYLNKMKNKVREIESFSKVKKM